MKKAEIKKILHAMVNSIGDKHVLYHLKENTLPYVIKYRTKKMDKANDDLTEEQIKQLDESIRHAEAGERKAISMKDVKKSFERWLPDEKKQKKKEEKQISKISKKKLREELHELINGIDSKYVLNVLLDDILPDAINNGEYE